MTTITPGATYPVATSGTTPPIYPTGSLTPTPPYSGTFIPVLWSTKLIEKFYASTVLAAISNTDYEGEIKNKGDKVIIRTKPTITIKDYKADGLLEVERPASQHRRAGHRQGQVLQPDPRRRHRRSRAT